MKKYLAIILLLKSFCMEAQTLKQEEFKSPPHNISIKKKVLVPTQTVVTAPTVTKGKRVALLIGNGLYQYGNSLGENPKNDANDMGQALKALGFDVNIITDANLQNMKTAIKSFQDKIAGAEMAAFFYAGHGVEIEGTKYIIPVDAQLKSPEDANDDAYNIESLFRRLRSGGAKHNLIILDACRNDPFRASNDKTHRAWGDTDRGFTPININKIDEGNVYLAMATDWGNKAQNGTGRNGIYTSQLLKQLKAGERLDRVFDLTGIAVKTTTQRKQNPQFFKEVSIDNEFFF